MFGNFNTILSCILSLFGCFLGAHEDRGQICNVVGRGKNLTPQKIGKVRIFAWLTNGCIDPGIEENRRKNDHLDRNEIE